MSKKTIQNRPQPWRKAGPPAGLKQVERDHMPVEVATAMLCAPKARSTNRERKIWMAARFVCFEPVQQRKPIEEKVAAKLKTVSWLQLHTWLSRTITRRTTTQCLLQAAQKKEAKLKEEVKNEKDKARQSWLAGLLLILQRHIAALDIRGMSLDAFRDSLETEIDRRVAPQVAS